MGTPTVDRAGGEHTRVRAGGRAPWQQQRLHSIGWAKEHLAARRWRQLRAELTQGRERRSDELGADGKTIAFFSGEPGTRSWSAQIRDAA